RRAAALYDEVLRLAPEDRAARQWRSLALSDLGHYQTMESALGSPVLLARVLADAGQLDEACAVLVGREQNAHARGLLALCLIRMEILDRAGELLDGPLPSAPWLLARLLVAIEEGAEMPAPEPPPAAECGPAPKPRSRWFARRQIRRGLACLHREKWQEAATAFRIASISLPDEGRAAYGLGVSLYYLGRWEEAQELLRQAVGRLDEPFRGAATATLGKIALELGDPPKALILLRRGIAAGAASPENYYALGLAHLRRGRKSLARRAFERCVGVGFVRQRFQEIIELASTAAGV